MDELLEIVLQHVEAMLLDALVDRHRRRTTIARHPAARMHQIKTHLLRVAQALVDFEANDEGVYLSDVEAGVARLLNNVYERALTPQPSAPKVLKASKPKVPREPNTAVFAAPAWLRVHTPVVLIQDYHGARSLAKGARGVIQAVFAETATCGVRFHDPWCIVTVSIGLLEVDQDA